jgi:hypothetical protein
MDFEEQNSRDNTAHQIIPRAEVRILVTEEDKTGEDLLAMSDFFGNYIELLSDSIRMNAVAEIVPEIPFADIGIINEVVHQAEVISEGTTQLLPDFDHLPKDIRQKLKDGVYKVGESRQVDGNMRAVIVDETGTRVKDVTLKEVHMDPGTMEASRSIANQLQMRQIYAKLDTIQEMQDYQIARDRDRDMKVPFLDARFYILKAQGPNCLPEDRKYYLEKASEKLLSAVNSVYTEMSTSADRLVKLTRFPIFQRKDQIKRYMGYLSEDLQVSTKLVGLRLQLLDYLGDKDGARIEMERYQRVMSDFFTKNLVGKNCSAAELIHMYFPYTEENRNCWYQLGVDIKPRLAALQSAGSEHIYLVSMEDIEDGEE